MKEPEESWIPTVQNDCHDFENWDDFVVTLWIKQIINQNIERFLTKATINIFTENY